MAFWVFDVWLFWLFGFDFGCFGYCGNLRFWWFVLVSCFDGCCWCWIFSYAIVSDYLVCVGIAAVGAVVYFSKLAFEFAFVWLCFGV